MLSDCDCVRVLCAKSCIENENVRTVFRTVAFSLCCRLARLSYLIQFSSCRKNPAPRKVPLSLLRCLCVFPYDFLFAACNFLLIFFLCLSLCVCRPLLCFFFSSPSLFLRGIVVNRGVYWRFLYFKFILKCFKIILIDYIIFISNLFDQDKR